MVVEACGWKGRRQGKERGGVCCVGMGGVCGRVKEKRRREGGRGGEEATDSAEHQNSHKQSFFFFLAWLVTFTEFEFFEMLPLVQTLSRLLQTCFRTTPFVSISFPCVSWWLLCPLEL